jgi:ADP-ribose pyrophosphatase YjhB (NUDIX family)
MDIQTPKLTVDAIVEYKKQIVLIERKNHPYGWALPGGFVDVGESVETAVRREMMEEINTELLDLKQFGVYSNPKRDPRFHTVSVIFTAKAKSDPFAGDDAKNVKLCSQTEIEELSRNKQICFDHSDILKDYFKANLS